MDLRLPRLFRKFASGVTKEVT